MQYSIQGDNLPVVICTLGQGEQMLTEKGAMSWICLLYTSPSPRD